MDKKQDLTAKEKKDRFNEEMQAKYNANFLRIRRWLIVMWLTSIVALVLPFLVTSDVNTTADLFQRAGSLLVLFAVLSDIQIRNINRFSESKAIGVTFIILDNQQRTIAFDIVNAALAVIGTGVWGYGDYLILLILA